MHLCLKTRADWYAKSPRSLTPELDVPVSYVVFSFSNKRYRNRTRPPLGANPSKEEIITELLYLQYGDNRIMCDIRYNFMIARDGCIYEGRGWLGESNLPIRIKDWRKHVLYVGYIGDFRGKSPPKEIFQARDEFLKYGVKNGFITKKFYTIQLPATDMGSNYKDYLFQ